MISYLDLLNRSFHCYYANLETLSRCTAYRLTNVYLIFPFYSKFSFFLILKDYFIHSSFAFLISKEFRSLSLSESETSYKLSVVRTICTQVISDIRAYLTLEGNRTKQALRDLPYHSV